MGAASPKSDKEVPFAAILVMCDPYEWYEALQVAIDVLCSPTPLSLEFDTTATAMPLHFSNPDFLSKFEHPFPRFAQGAFKVPPRRSSSPGPGLRPPIFQSDTPEPPPAHAAACSAQRLLSP
jgi:hypothetical protein